MISKTDVENLANLARIRLSENEKETMATEITSILSYIDSIKNVDIRDSQDKTNLLLNRNKSRDDEVFETSTDDRKKILDQAPEIVNEFVAVKKIIS